MQYSTMTFSEFMLAGAVWTVASLLICWAWNRFEQWCETRRARQARARWRS